jgi:hypothetical protein
MIKTLTCAFAFSLLFGPLAQAQEPTQPEQTEQPPEAAPTEEDRAIAEQRVALGDIFNRPATPYVVGAIKLDVSRFTVATDRVTRGQAVLRGTADHAQVGRLTAELNLRDALQNQNIPAGTPMYLVEFVSKAGAPRAADDAPWQMIAVWCGNFDRKTVFGTPSPSLCLFDNDPRAQLLGPRRAYLSLQSRTWITTSSAVMPASFVATNFKIERVSDQPFGPMDIRLEVSRVRGRDLRLTLFATRGGDDVVVKRFDLPVTDGRAMLPLWDHRLQFVVDRDSVTASLTNDGDGSSPLLFSGYPA